MPQPSPRITPWATPLREVQYEKRSFDNPLLCPRCHGPMRLIAVIKDPKAIAAILDHPAHRHDDPDSGPDPPQPHLDLQPHLEAFEPA